MRKFDPWPIFFKREWSRNWPFLVVFAITGTLITKMTAGLTEEDAKLEVRSGAQEVTCSSTFIGLKEIMNGSVAPSFCTLFSVASEVCLSWYQRL